MQYEENVNMEVRQAGGSSEMEGDLDWGEIDKHGADSKAEQYHMNNDQTPDFGELEDDMDVKAYKAPGKGQITRKVKKKRRFRNFYC